jgi:hypothetical protein
VRSSRVVSLGNYSDRTHVPNPHGSTRSLQGDGPPVSARPDEDQANYRRLLISFTSGFLAVAFAIPLAVGCVGFLGARIGRWVWAGFTTIT